MNYSFFSVHILSSRKSFQFAIVDHLLLFESFPPPGHETDLLTQIFSCNFSFSGSSVRDRKRERPVGSAASLKSSRLGGTNSVGHSFGETYRAEFYVFNNSCLLRRYQFLFFVLVRRERYCGDELLSITSLFSSLQLQKMFSKAQCRKILPSSKQLHGTSRQRIFFSTGGLP